MSVVRLKSVLLNSKKNEATTTLPTTLSLKIKDIYTLPMKKVAYQGDYP